MTEQCRRNREGAGQMDGSKWAHKNGDPRIPDPHHTGRSKPQWECYGCDDEIVYVGERVAVTGGVAVGPEAGA